MAGECPVEHWCVCQWAFSSYLANAGGCDYVQDVVCDAINLEAVLAYEASSDPNHAVALACIQERCPGAGSSSGSDPVPEPQPHPESHSSTPEPEEEDEGVSGTSTMINEEASSSMGNEDIESVTASTGALEGTRAYLYLAFSIAGAAVLSIVMCMIHRGCRAKVHGRPHASRTDGFGAFTQLDTVSDSPRNSDSDIIP